MLSKLLTARGNHCEMGLLHPTYNNGYKNLNNPKPQLNQARTCTHIRTHTGPVMGKAYHDSTMLKQTIKSTIVSLARHTWERYQVSLTKIYVGGKFI